MLQKCGCDQVDLRKATTFNLSRKGEIFEKANEAAAEQIHAKSL